MRLKNVLAAACMAAVGPLAAQAGTSVNVVELTAGQIETGLKNGTFTDQDLVQSYLNRIDKYNSNYNAFTYLNPDALQQAAGIDAQIKANGVTLPLEGVPVVVKDSMNLAGVRTTGGYSGFTSENGGVNMVAATDAPIVARLKAAGAIILGKTNLPQFARSGASANTSYLGPTYNPYNRFIIPGGSSSGSATAVNASFAALGTAEETGGSIENPAGAQSLVGIKTTFGLVPTSGGIPLNGQTRDVFGTLAKTVTDASNMLSVIAGYDSSDPKTAASIGHIPAAGYAAGLDLNSLQGKRFGLFGTGFKSGITLTPETQQLYQNAINVLTSHGATVVTDPFTADAAKLSVPFNTIASTFSKYSGLAEPYDINQWMKTLAPGSPHSTAEFQAATGINLLKENGPLIGAYASTPGLAAAVADPTVSPDLTPFFAGRTTMLGEFEQVMKDENLNGFFFPQMFSELPALPAVGVGGSYPNTTVSEVNLLGTPLVDLSGGYYADGSPFSVAFLGDTWSEPQLLSDAYAFEQATNFRVAPTLAVPLPSGLWMGCIGLAMGCVMKRVVRARPA
jgi:Asp-tRNA(Asn)/Glu-tRNA(Gln) amidotransferase A subunit family amidase